MSAEVVVCSVFKANMNAFFLSDTKVRKSTTKSMMYNILAVYPN